MARSEPRKPTSARGRQAGDYRPPILVEPQGGPVPDGEPKKDDAEEG